MTELEKLKKRQFELADRLSEIAHSEGELTEKQCREIDTLGEEVRSNEQAIDKIRADERRRKLVEESRAKWGSTHVSPATGDPYDIDTRRADSRTVLERARQIVGERGQVTEHLADEQRAQVEKLLRTKTDATDGAEIARHIVASSREEYRSAFMKAVRGKADEITDVERRAISEVRALAIGTGSTGGFAVPAVLDPTLIMTGQGSSNPILNMARVETITNDKWKGLSSAGMTWQFNAEAAETTDNSPEVAQPEVPVHRADGFIPFSIEVDMDWPSFASDMSTLIQSGYLELLAENLAIGTGANTPVGLVSRLAATTTARVGTATAGTVAPSDIYGLWNSLPERIRGRQANAWLSSVSVESTIRQFGTTDPNFSVNITEDGISRLFGRPYRTTDYMSPAVSGTTAGNLLVVGDMRGFLVAQRAGMNIELVSHLMGTNRRPTGERGFFAWARVGSDVIDPTALKLLQNKTS
ncbi:phage major capsid protein [Micromonospora sp. NPDC000442]|uniref:phage major capsid protein n=1 Tax=Micromonospora sp. NPDC000442 TaxID=3364217 RepID=UPI003680D87D